MGKARDLSLWLKITSLEFSLHSDDIRIMTRKGWVTGDRGGQRKMKGVGVYTRTSGVSRRL